MTPLEPLNPVVPVTPLEPLAEVVVVAYTTAVADGLLWDEEGAKIPIIVMTKRIPTTRRITFPPVVNGSRGLLNVTSKFAL